MASGMKRRRKDRGIVGLGRATPLILAVPTRFVDKHCGCRPQARGYRVGRAFLPLKGAARLQFQATIKQGNLLAVIL